MPAGGRRPGAGRPRNSKTALQLAAEATKKSTARPTAAGTSETEDPGYILGLVARGETNLPDGRKITSEMRLAAKELLPYYKPRLSTTNKVEERRGPPEEASQDDLLYERTQSLRSFADTETELADTEAALAATEKELADARNGGEPRVADTLRCEA